MNSLALIGLTIWLAIVAGLLHFILTRRGWNYHGYEIQGFYKGKMMTKEVVRW